MRSCVLSLYHCWCCIPAYFFSIFPIRKEKEGFLCPGERGLPDFRPVLTWDLQSGHKLTASSSLSFEGTMEAGQEEPAGFSSG